MKVQLQVGDRIMINGHSKPMKVLELPENMQDTKSYVRLEIQNRYRTKVSAQVGHLVNGEVKFVQKPL